MGERRGSTEIVPYIIESTKEIFTSRAGLVSIAEVMKSVNLTALVDEAFPPAGSNRGFKPSTFVNTLLLMLLEGGRCLDDLAYIREDKGLRTLLNLEHVPESDTLGDWLRRMGAQGVLAVTAVNRPLLRRALKKKGCTKVTVDIDATLCASKNKAAKGTYKKCTGYMPMVAHIAETGQILHTEFREGNVAPATDNLGFLHASEAALPEGVTVGAVRIDSAGYQYKIIDECIDRQLTFAIRVKMNPALKHLIARVPQEQWSPLVSAEDEGVIEGESTCTVVYTMEKSRHGFSVVVQRREKKRRLESETEEKREADSAEELFESGDYVYRALAVSHELSLSESAWVHWYNQRGEASENRIKELKSDFGAGRIPCRDFGADSLYFALCGLAYNVFVLLRMALPLAWQKKRGKCIRLRLFALAGKVVRHGRQYFLKLAEGHAQWLHHVICLLKRESEPHALPQAP